MTSRPPTTLHDVMAEAAKLSELHAALDQGHAEATAEAFTNRPADVPDTVEEETVER